MTAVGATGATGGADADAIAPVIARMEAINGQLPAKDGVAYFNRLYLEVTRAVRTATATATFNDPAFVSRLDVIFAGLYFDAEATVSTGGACPVAWRPLVAQRDRGHAPIQFALAGMNAHINHDLPLAVVATCQEMGLSVEPGSPQHADYQSVNNILRQVETQVAEWFKTGLIAAIEDVVPEDVDNALAMWSIVAARDLAWDHARMVWSLRRIHEVQLGYEDVLARMTELAGLAMLV